MKRKDWKKRINKRNDMASRITHLTRGKDNDEAFENLWKILVDRKINGSGNFGFINGRRKAVCLQELLLSAITENLMYEKVLNDKVRYSPFGILVNQDVLVAGSPPAARYRNTIAKYSPGKQNGTSEGFLHRKTMAQ